MKLRIENIESTNDLIFIIDNQRFRKGMSFVYFNEEDVFKFFGNKIYNKFMKGENEFVITKKQYNDLFFSFK